MTVTQDVLAEIAARHVEAPWPPYRGKARVGTQCAACNRTWPCDAVRLAVLVRTPETLDRNGVPVRRRYDLTKDSDPAHDFDGPDPFAAPAPDPGAGANVELCPDCEGTGYVRHSGDMHFRVAPSAEPPETETT